MSDTESLTDVVAAIDAKATRKDQTERVDQKVAAVRGTLSQLNSNIKALADDVAELQFYRELLIEMFDEEIPPEAESALADATAAVDPDTTTIITELLEDPTGDADSAIAARQNEIAAARDDVQDATSELEDLLRGHRDEWEERLASARDLQAIIGEQNDEFAWTVSWLEDILQQKIWETNRTASAVVQEWANATDQWADHQDLQGLEAFQETHNLSDDAIAEIERLSSTSDRTLADVDIDTLHELQSVPELAAAVKLSI